MPSVRTPADLMRTLGYPAEIQLDDPNKAVGGPYSRWVYYFEQPNGNLEEISYYFVGGELRTNEVLGWPDKHESFRLLRTDNLADTQKIMLHKHTRRR
jgi:hypothetical protein